MNSPNPIVGDESGATIVEYGLLLGLIAIVCLAAIVPIGTNLSSVFQNVASTI